VYDVGPVLLVHRQGVHHIRHHEGPKRHPLRSRFLPHSITLQRILNLDSSVLLFFLSNRDFKFKTPQMTLYFVERHGFQLYLVSCIFRAFGFFWSPLPHFRRCLPKTPCRGHPSALYFCGLRRLVHNECWKSPIRAMWVTLPSSFPVFPPTVSRHAQRVY
jgi:hypothetical protein